MDDKTPLTPLLTIETAEPEREEPPSVKHRWVKRLAIPLIFFLLLGGAFYTLDPIGWAAEKFLVYESPMRSAQAALIYTPGEIARVAELHRNDTIQRILIARGPYPRYENAEPPISVHIYIQRALVEAGVPEEAIDALPRQPESMLDEQRLLRDWMLKEGVGSFIHYTAYYHSRYYKIRHDKTFTGLGVEAVIQPIRNDNPIWRKEALAIQNLMIRLAFWRFVYQPILLREAHNLTSTGHLDESIGISRRIDAHPSTRSRGDIQT